QTSIAAEGTPFVRLKGRCWDRCTRRPAERWEMNRRGNGRGSRQIEGTLARAARRRDRYRRFLRRSVSFVTWRTLRAPEKEREARVLEAAYSASSMPAVYSRRRLGPLRCGSSFL